MLIFLMMFVGFMKRKELNSMIHVAVINVENDVKKIDYIRYFNQSDEASRFIKEFNDKENITNDVTSYSYAKQMSSQG